MVDKSLDLTTIRAKLAQARGPHYWRSLEELANTAEFQDFLFREFPRQASEWPGEVSRRHFLKLMGASLALAGLTGCSGRSPEEIVPYVQAPEEVVPGKPLFYATVMPLGGYATGLLVESNLGRPTKIEGNSDHPASLGATDALTQASILTLYDPDRAQTVSKQGQPSDWAAFLAELQPALEQQRAGGGAGLHILTETVTSPTLAAQLQQLLAQFPSAKWYQYEPINRDNVGAGAQQAFGEAVETFYRFDQAEVVLSLDADFLSTFPGSVRYARDFAAKRRVGVQGGEMNRLYVIESTPSLTGAAADHRLPLPARSIESAARALAQALGLSVAPGAETALNAMPENWIEVIVRDLQAHQGAGIVITGDHQPPGVHALVHAINAALGNAGQTVIYTDPVAASPANQTDSLRELVTAMAAGQVELLLILGGNPVFTAPADLNFAGALDQVKFSVHWGLYADETSERCHWHLPESHYLEAWGDTRAYDGTISLIQPLIEPLYDSRSAQQVLAALLGQADSSDHDLVRAYWENHNSAGDFGRFWQTTLFNGFVAETALAVKSVSLQPDFDQPTPLTGTEDLEIIFRPDPSIWDGRFANNGWLQELPKPLTKLTWDNAALLSPATAATLGLVNEDLVELQYQGQAVRAPVWILPGQTEGSVTIHLGYGRTRAGRVGTGAGFNAYALRTTTAPWFGAGLKVVKTGGRYPLAGTQLHQNMEGRDLIRVGTLAQFQAKPDFSHKPDDPLVEEVSLYPPFKYEGNAWGMTVDLSSCNGCNACVVACQAENNIPIVGKDQVIKGREMHWIRLDHYFEGEPDNPASHHQPILCMHCENAPCEVVCPVAATMHDHEGLNMMVYNRCIGTRYCSNNCPYKVRRFNFLQFTDLDTESLKLQRNPEVTVRSRGVMEKCTYCVQRISAARITAKEEGRTIRDGEVVTACQGACPTQAIVFGNINDPGSQVAQLKGSPLNYGLLTELNTHPRTTYLAKLKNPNPELADTGQGG